MTRTQAWRTVAEAFGTPPEQRTAEQQKLARCGLCFALSHLDPYPWPYAQMGCDGLGLWFGNYREHDGERALFAGLMAAMTQGERTQLEPGL